MIYESYIFPKLFSNIYSFGYLFRDGNSNGRAAPSEILILKAEW